jgi:hypothetical protein
MKERCLQCKEMLLWYVSPNLSNLCLYKNEQHEVDDWKAVRYRYSEYIRYTLEKFYGSDKQLNQYKEKIVEHLEKLYSFPHLNFYIK